MADSLSSLSKLTSWIGSYWLPTSQERLQDAESKILQRIQKPWEGNFVKVGKNVEIWTLKVNTQEASGETPLVLVHGFISGVCWWVQSFDVLSEKRTVYAFDLPGFGRSSRPEFSSTPEEAEDEFVQYIEEWRKAVGLEKFILLGHSLGGYLVTAYALKYPDRVHHLILSDPWGFSILPYGAVDRHPDSPFSYNQLPKWLHLGNYFTNTLNFLTPVRLLGPLGPYAVSLARFDPNKKDSALWKEGAVFEYIYHCNAQTPTGENAFRNMNFLLGWAKHPMIKRAREIDPKMRISIMYGSWTFLDHRTAYELKCIRPELSVDVYIVKDAGHDIHVDNAGKFNEIMADILCKCARDVDDEDWMAIETIDEPSQGD
ncbi:predicted protein [Nematostella vectensis]|uniref:AB hydrolase-1 domain-containing protein n=1 Tax=Nematostella vectensis TaxID=45351 RepID=A7S6S7_NEMVE|nr:(Lyso)-N-acylphosphatidylethanolamine lipase [Nematostella vectensis]EDO40607.1 predicted protein [Nematostella vectensis]|eukprot:XP_001632670.1 predicted protein [Nematostella vectensis]